MILSLPTDLDLNINSLMQINHAKCGLFPVDRALRAFRGERCPDLRTDALRRAAAQLQELVDVALRDLVQLQDLSAPWGREIPEICM